MGISFVVFVSFVVYAVALPEAGAVFLQDAAIHDHEDAGLAGFLRRLFVNDALLHPDHGHLQADRLVDNLFHKFGPAEDVDDVDFLRTSSNDAYAFSPREPWIFGLTGMMR